MFLRTFAILLSILLMAAGLPNMRVSPWQVVDLPTDRTLLDIAFVGGSERGWIVGDKGTLLETRDGGINWKASTLQTSNPDYYLTSISFNGQEGWVAGEPKVMLHTTDGGDRWAQIPLSDKLPGEPMLVAATADNTAEMVTTVGALYRTEDGGRNWTALVDDAIGVLRNVSRRDDGAYVGVSARGNFYTLHRPGSRLWEPFNRDSSRRLQNMGFGPGNSGWKLNRGAEVSFTDDITSGEWGKAQRPGRTTSFGYLGATYQDPDNVWVVGGSGTLVHSGDGGQTWEQVKEASNIPANFYSVKFINPERGFILGQRGTLLRYTQTS